MTCTQCGQTLHRLTSTDPAAHPTFCDNACVFIYAMGLNWSDSPQSSVVCDQTGGKAVWRKACEEELARLTKEANELRRVLDKAWSEHVASLKASVRAEKERYEERQKTWSGRLSNFFGGGRH